ncbi:MAG: type II toxin-antitoxin system RatA family toxin [Magnetococcales bacterium]|nr:type II toxin-antitoxin system RatA family toxin [Magnetococcales bacterium]
MAQLRISEKVPFTAAQMYDLVADVEKYPQFLPWCVGSRVFDRKEDGFTAEMTVAFKGMRETFQTVDKIVPGSRIDISLRSGPFKYLTSTWAFKPDSKGSRVEFFIRFKFQSRLKEMVLGPVFTVISKQMLDAFRKRAHVIYK